VAIGDFYNSTVRVDKSTTTTTSSGGVKETWSTRIASLPCRITRWVMQESDEFGKITARVTWRLYCDANSDGLSIDTADRIIMSGGTTLQVKTIYNPGELDRHLEIDCLELD